MYTETLTFLLTLEEKTALLALAQDDSTSQGAVLRRLIRQAAKKRNLWPSGRSHDLTAQEVGRDG
jgi:hypothetical protein